MVRRYGCRVIVLLITGFAGGWMHGTAHAWTELTGSLEPVDLGQWDGFSSLSQASPSVCVLATFFQKNDNPSYYRVKARSTVAGDTEFLLHKDTDPGITIPITVEWLGADINTGNLGAIREVLAYDTWPGNYPFGGRNDDQCKSGAPGDNGQLVVSADGVLMQSLSLPPGTYTAELEIDMLANQLPGAQIKNLPTSVFPILVIPGQVKVGNLDDIFIDATAWMSGTLSAVEDFCIGTNFASGSLAVTVSSGSPGAGGEFQVSDLVGSAGSEVYTATLYTGSGATGTAVPLISGAQQTPFDPGTAQALDCAGDNVSLEVNFDATALGNMQSSGAETWGDTITIEVTPN